MSEPKNKTASTGPAVKNPARTVAIAPKNDPPLFNIVEDGNGLKHRIANMNHPLVCPRRGVIELEATKRSNANRNNVSFCNAYDPKLRIWYGEIVDIDAKTGNFIWKRFYLSDFQQYNLQNENEAIAWAIASRQVFVAGSPFQKGKIIYKKYDTDAIAEETIKRISHIDEAVKIAKNMKLKDYIHFVRFLGKSPENMSPVKLQAETYEVAKNSPLELIAYFNNGNKTLVDLFNSAKSIGLITYHLTNGWMYKGATPLGKSEPLVLKYIKDNVTFASNLMSETSSQDKALEMIKGRSGNNDSDVDNDNYDMLALKFKAQLMKIANFEVMSAKELTDRINEMEEMGDTEDVEPDEETGFNSEEIEVD